MHPCPIYVAIVPSLITMRLTHILEELGEWRHVAFAGARAHRGRVTLPQLLEQMPGRMEFQ